VTDPVVTWNTTTIDGKQWVVINAAQFRIPLDWDPSSGMFIAVGPNGAWAQGPFLAKGDPGAIPTFDSDIQFTVLDFDDPTPDSATLNLLGVVDGVPDYQAAITIHRGPPGTPGTATLDVNAYGTPLSGRILIVNPTNDGFLYQPQLVGDRFIPSAINSAPAGNPLYTLTTVSVPGQAFDWRPEVSGQCIISKTGFGNVTVDLIARLNDAAAGNIVGRGFGSLDNTQHATVLSSGPPAGSASTYDKVSAGQAATIYLRAERQTGTDTFTTSNSTTKFEVRVKPIPPGAS
jgi:hypothetical protein